VKFCLQLNPQVSIDKPAERLMPTLIEQVRLADAVGFDAFSMGRVRQSGSQPTRTTLSSEPHKSATGG
jgi:hypothetical protein